jgi:hypothetical protein
MDTDRYRANNANSAYTSGRVCGDVACESLELEPTVTGNMAGRDDVIYSATNS